MRKRIFVFVPCVLAAAVAAFGTEGRDLRGLAEAALGNDPDRLEAADSLRGAEADAAAERARRLLDGSLSARGSAGARAVEPGTRNYGTGAAADVSTLGPAGAKIDLGVDYSANSAEGPSKDGAWTDAAKAQAAVSLPVFANGRLVDGRLGPAAEAAALALPLEKARAAASAAERKAVDGALRAALDLASAARKLDLADRAAALAEREAAIARVKRGLGALSYSELAKIEKEADEARLAAQEARFLRDARLRALSAVCGIAAAAIEPAAIRAPGLRDDLEAGLDPDSSPAVEAAVRGRREAEAARILKGAQEAPTFGLSGSWSTPGPLARSAGPADEASWSAGATLKVPLPTGAGSASLKAADARLSAAVRAEEADRRKARSDLAAAVDALAAARARVAFREDRASQALARLAEAKSALDSQTATELDAERALLAADEAAAALEDAKADAFKAALDAYSLCGLDPLRLLD